MFHNEREMWQLHLVIGRTTQSNTALQQLGLRWINCSIGGCWSSPQGKGRLSPYPKISTRQPYGAASIQESRFLLASLGIGSSQTARSWLSTPSPGQHAHRTLPHPPSPSPCAAAKPSQKGAYLPNSSVRLGQHDSPSWSSISCTATGMPYSTFATVLRDMRQPSSVLGLCLKCVKMVT